MQAVNRPGIHGWWHGGRGRGGRPALPLPALVDPPQAPGKPANLRIMHVEGDSMMPTTSTSGARGNWSGCRRSRRLAVLTSCAPELGCPLAPRLDQETGRRRLRCVRCFTRCGATARRQPRLAQRSAPRSDLARGDRDPAADERDRDLGFAKEPSAHLILAAAAVASMLVRSRFR
jgi:hypothetical protein